ncbi:tryptophan-rich sensory protein [Patescibacteria group bacterium]|nr:tryptophan-rich sensory protein [Patescibacteria group bacterium]MBU1754690.1 tryptophan-rich sensory protein [Patescibacteria group bacterium]
MKLNTILIYILCIGLSLGAGALGSIGMVGQVTGWYTTLTLPSWNPPSWVFGPVWTLLYILMGTAAALVWTRSKKLGRITALWFFFAHLVVNALWSVVFFGLHEIGAALLVIAILWALVFTLVFWFKKYNHLSAWLLVPYLLWVTYASTLNLGILLLN